MNEILSNIKQDMRAIPALESVDIDPNLNSPGSNIMHDVVFKKLESIAKKADEVNLSNEKIGIQNKINLNLANFKTEYLTDPTIYDDPARLKDVMKKYDEITDTNKNLVLDSKYLSNTDVEKFNGAITTEAKGFMFQQKLASNKAYIKNTVGKVLDNNNQTMLAMDQLDVDDIDYPRKRDALNKNMVTGVMSLTKLGYTKEKAQSMLSKSLIKSQIAQETKMMFTNVVSNDSLNYEEKKDALKGLKTQLQSEDYTNATVEDLSKYYDGEDKDEFKKELKNQYKANLNVVYGDPKDTDGFSPTGTDATIAGYTDVSGKSGVYYEYKRKIEQQHKNSMIEKEQVKSVAKNAMIKDTKLKNQVIALREKGDYLNAYRKQGEPLGIVVDTEQDIDKNFYDIYGTAKETLINKGQSVSVVSSQTEAQATEILKSKELSYSEKAIAMDKILPEDNDLREIELKHLHDIGKIDYDSYTWAKDDVQYRPIADSMSNGKRYPGQLIFRDNGNTRTLTNQISKLPLEDQSKVKKMVSNYIRGEIIKVIPDSDVAKAKNLNDVYTAAINSGGINNKDILEATTDIVNKAMENGIRKVNVYRYKENIPKSKPVINKKLVHAKNINDAYSILGV